VAPTAYDFDNAENWVTVPGVPVLDEHDLHDPTTGRREKVDGKVLREIAANNNRRVLETNNPAPLCVGHTSDDPQAPERPVVGYAVNFRVGPFMDTGREALFVDYKVRKDKADVAKDFPRRSVELWWGKKEIDPIALLGGTTPERDLGDIGAPGSPFAGVLKFSRATGELLVYRYAMPVTPEERPMSGAACKPTKMEREDEPDAGAPGGAAGGDEGGDDPVVAKVLASKPIAEMRGQIGQILNLLQELGGNEGEPDGDETGAGLEPEPAAGQESMAAQTGQHPVRLEDHPQHYSAAGIPGANGGYIPHPERTRMNRQPTARPGYPYPTDLYAPEPAAADLPPDIAKHPAVIRMQRQIADQAKAVADMVQEQKLTRARERVVKLARKERIDFTPPAGSNLTADQLMEAEAVLFSQLDPAAATEYEAKIKMLYRRRPVDPVAHQTAGPVQYARTGQGGDAPVGPDQVQAAVSQVEDARRRAFNSGQKFDVATVLNQVLGHGSGTVQTR